MHWLGRALFLLSITGAVGASLAAGCSSDQETGAGATAGAEASATGSTTSAGGTASIGAGGLSTGTGGTGGVTTTGTATGGTTTTTTGSGAGGLPPPTSTSPCQGHIYECGDLLDNDGDGLIDYQDPDCLGPCDNTEGSLFGGIPGQAGPACFTDCYFDQDSGTGNDDCYWSHKCDPNDVSPNYYPEAPYGSQCTYNPNASIPGTMKTCAQLSQMQSQQCLNYCGPLTPNGCDCFGCCELPAGTGHYVWLGSDNDQDGANGGTCTLDAVNDPTKCQPCTPVAACLNTCETCELCIGKTTLPPECYPDAGTTTTTGTGGSGTTSGTGGSTTVCPQCAAGVQPCGVPGCSAGCPSGYYCITGCCQALPK